MGLSVLITGAAGGIGEALAKEFHSKGLLVFATARTVSKIQHLKDQGMETLELDVTSKESIQNAVATVEKATGGKLDFLVNNSGIGYSMPLLDSDIAVAKEVYDVNVFGLVAVTQAFAPLLIATKGKVINISSIVSKAAMPYMGFYNGSKAAVNSISDTLRMELAPFDVKVITIITGTIATHFFASQPPSALPESSLYRPVEAEYEASVRQAPPGSMDPREYARGIVANALKENSSLYLWRGGSALIIRIVTTLLPFWVPDLILSKNVKLDLLKGRLTKKRD